MASRSIVPSKDAIRVLRRLVCTSLDGRPTESQGGPRTKRIAGANGSCPPRSLTIPARKKDESFPEAHPAHNLSEHVLQQSNPLERLPSKQPTPEDVQVRSVSKLVSKPRGPGEQFSSLTRRTSASKRNGLPTVAQLTNGPPLTNRDATKPRRCFKPTFDASRPPTMVLYVGPYEVVPDFREHKLAAKKQAGHVVWDRTYCLYNYMLYAMDNLGSEDSRHDLFRRTMEKYAGTGLDEDWQVVLGLFSYFCRHHSPVFLREFRNSFVEQLLSLEIPRLEAVQLLYLRQDNNAMNYDKYAQDYLAAFCEKYPEQERQLLELEKLIQGLESSHVLWGRTLLLPIIQKAVDLGRPDDARKILECFVARYKTEPSGAALVHIVKGFGRQQNWSAIDSLVTWVYDRETARTRPNTFASMITWALHFYVQHFPAERAYDYVMYYVQNRGLVPDTAISSKLLGALIQSRRWDLVAQWVRERRTRFTTLFRNVYPRTISLEVTRSWSAISASSRDVLNTCTSLAAGLVQSPFGDDLKQSALWIVLDDIRGRCSALSQTLDGSEPAILEEIHGRFELYTFAHDLLAQSSKHGSKLKVSLQAKDLASQLEAAKELDVLVSNFRQYVQQLGVIRWEQPKDFLPTTRVEQKPKKKLIKLPSPESGTAAIVDVLMRYHEQALHDKLVPTSVAFVYLLEEISASKREIDGLRILKALHTEGRDNPIPFTHSTFEYWLRFARDLGSRTDLALALWAIVDDREEAQITPLMFLQISTALDRVFRIRAKEHRPECWEELMYLKDRILRKRMGQSGWRPIFADID